MHGPTWTFRANITPFSLLGQSAAGRGAAGPADGGEARHGAAPSELLEVDGVVAIDEVCAARVDAPPSTAWTIYGVFSMFTIMRRSQPVVTTILPMLDRSWPR